MILTLHLHFLYFYHNFFKIKLPSTMGYIPPRDERIERLKEKRKKIVFHLIFSFNCMIDPIFLALHD